MINRAAVILKYKEPAVKWINDADPYNENPGILLDSVNEENTVYLISDQDADSSVILKKWLNLNYKTLFESELEEWYTDEKLWPKKRNLTLFHEWFEIQGHTMIIDSVEGSIEEDEI